MNAHCKLRQSSEMVQSPVVPSRDKVWVLRLLRESHIWDRVTLWGQVGGSDVGDGESDSEAERNLKAEVDGKADDGEGNLESKDEEGESGRTAEVCKVGAEDERLAAQCM